VRLVDPDGAQLGVVTIEEARAKAEELGLDLVEVNPNVRPIVCRIMDYGRYKYDKQKKERKSKTAASELKQIKFRPGIDDHDFEVKVEKLRRFLLAGNKARVTIMFRRRDMRRPENGIRLMERVVATLADVSRSEDAPTMMGEGARDLTLTLNPVRQPAKKVQAEAQPHRLRRHEREALAQGGGAEEPADDVAVDLEDEDDEEDDEDAEDDDADDGDDAR
jgi:translation initiation factor IF-3